MKPTKPPAYMQPGTRSVLGSGLSPDAHGEANSGTNSFMPADVELMPGGPSTVEYYNGAQPAFAGGGVKQKGDIKTMPMGSE